MLKLSVFLGVLLAVLKDTSGIDLPADIEKCAIHDKKCFVDRANEIIAKYPHGYPELGVPDLNPLLIGSFEIKQDSGENLKLNLKISDMKIVDFNNIRHINTSGFENEEWNNTVLTFLTTSPKMTVQANYAISGKILVFPIEGSGDLNVVLDKPTNTAKIKISVHKKEDGKTYVHIEKVKIKTETEKMTIQMNNLFNGDKTLGDNLNKVMNDNWKVLWDEIEPAIEREIAKVFKKTMQDFWQNHPIEDIYLQ